LTPITVLLIVLGYFGYSIRKDQFFEIREYMIFIADPVFPLTTILLWSIKEE